MLLQLLPIDIAWLLFVPGLSNTTTWTCCISSLRCLNCLLIWSRRRYLNKLLFQSPHSCLDWRFSVSESTQLHKFVGVPVHAQMSDLAIDRLPTQLPDLTYATVSAKLFKFNWQVPSDVGVFRYLPLLQNGANLFRTFLTGV